MRTFIHRETSARVLDMAGLEQFEIRQKIIEQEAELCSTALESRRREIRQRIFKLQEQLDRHMRIYGLKG